MLIPFDLTQYWPCMLRQVADLPESRHGHSAVRLGDSVVVCGGLSGRHIHERWELERRIRKREMSPSLSQKALLHLLGDHRQVEGDWGAGPGWPGLQWNGSNGQLRVPGECHNFLTLHNIDPMSRWAAGRISTLGTTLKGTGSTPPGSWSTAPPGQCSFSSFKQRILPIKHIN